MHFISNKIKKRKKQNLIITNKAEHRSQADNQSTHITQYIQRCKYICNLLSFYIITFQIREFMTLVLYVWVTYTCNEVIF